MSRCLFCNSNNDCYDFCGKSSLELQEEIQKLQAENDKLKSDLIEIEVGYILTSASKLENGEGDKDYFIYKTAMVCKKYGLSLVITNLKDRQQTPLIQWCIDLINELNREELKEGKNDRNS
jgi:hypothetical protein